MSNELTPEVNTNTVSTLPTEVLDGAEAESALYDVEISCDETVKQATEGKPEPEQASSLWQMISTSLPFYSGHRLSSQKEDLSPWQKSPDESDSSTNSLTYDDEDDDCHIVPANLETGNDTRPKLPEISDMKRTMLWLVRFAIVADQLCGYILGPNHALMVLPGGSPESFPTTHPVGYSTAYNLLSTYDLGTVVASLGFGYLSDKIGRKHCLLACMYGGALGCILKYLARQSFWAYTGMNFVAGLFSGSPAVGAAYMSDLFTDQATVDAEIGNLIAIAMVSRVGGGIIAVCMESYGLFAPLWVSVAVSMLAGVLCHVFLRDVQGVKPPAKSSDEEDPESIAVAAAKKLQKGSGPQKLDKRAMWTILAGQLADNIGSLGLIPFAISPLMFNAFYQNFVSQGLEPIMSATAYKWVYTCVALSVVPGAILAPVMYQYLGPAISVVTANLLTGGVTLVLLYVANASPTVATFAIFVVIFYVSWPLAVISQLSTGPMLDRITPESQRGQIQGYNVAIMSLAGALGQIALGALADSTSIDICLYTTAAVSLGAALINSPLIRDERFGPTKEEDKALLPTTTDPSKRLSSVHIHSRRTSMLLSQGASHRASRFMLPRISV